MIELTWTKRPQQADCSLSVIVPSPAVHLRISRYRARVPPPAAHLDVMVAIPVLSLTLAVQRFSPRINYRPAASAS